VVFGSRLLGRGLLCSRPCPKLPLPSDLPCMTLPGIIGQSQLRVGMMSALIIFFVCSHPGYFAPVPSGSVSSIAIGWVFVWLLYIVRKAILSTHW
jgi:hypothetical protein